MSIDIILDYGEFSKASNRITAYGDFLANCLVEYQEIIRDMEETGKFSDKEATSNLNKIVNGLQPYEKKIVGACEETERIIKANFREVTNVDTFKYPNEIMDIVRNNTR